MTDEKGPKVRSEKRYPDEMSVTPLGETKVDRPGREIYVRRPVRADGRRLKAARERKRTSVRELSDLSGVSTSVIYRLEKGRPRQSWVETHNLRKLAGALGVETSELTKE